MDVPDMASSPCFWSAAARRRFAFVFWLAFWEETKRRRAAALQIQNVTSSIL
jgi:hypothetical protein